VVQPGGGGRTVTRLPALNETGPLGRVVLKHAQDAFVSRRDITAQWRALNFTAAPDFDRAVAEYDAFARIISDSGAGIFWLPRDDRVGMDSIYVRDATALVPDGLVSCAMGKPLRATEPDVQRTTLISAGVQIAGHIGPPGRLEGGDIVWLDATTVAVGRGYRTNDDGIAQFARFAGPHVTCMTVPLPHWRGPDDVFHLMSVISPVDTDLAVVYSPLLPVPFHEFLCDRGWRLVEVPHEEFASMGANVLALGPRRCVMLEGNPITRRRLEAFGAEVITYDGREISVKGGGGPTCLTRPLVRT
jgi:N-dimethylarginine dimethylaminohydrolase